MALSNFVRSASFQRLVSWGVARGATAETLCAGGCPLKPATSTRCSQRLRVSLHRNSSSQVLTKQGLSWKISDLCLLNKERVCGGAQQGARKVCDLNGGKLRVLAQSARARASVNHTVRPFTSSSSKSEVDPAMHALLGDLASQAPAFPIDGDNIQVLSTPSEYFEALLDGIANARFRVVLASLYLGTDEMEQRLADALGEAAAANPELQVTLLFDALRGTRPTGGKDGTPTSTADLICKSVLSQAGSWVKASLYHTPELSGFWKRFLPARYNETVGIMHLKAYVFDDTTLMSGANLSTSYFTDRQDRYMLLQDCPPLASYLTGLVNAVSHFSYPLEPDGTLGAPPCGIDPITDPERFKRSAGDAVRDFVKNAADVSKEPLTPPGERSGPPSGKSDRTASGGLVLDQTAVDTWVLPTVQMGPLGVRQDERATLSFFRRLPRHSLVHLASAYFNLAAPYEEALLEALRESLRVKIVTAAPTANGFYGSRGPSGLIPGAYSLMEQRLYERAGGDHQAGLEIFEYSREGWTFHAKGLWLSMVSENGRASENGSVSQNGSASENGNVSQKGGFSSAPCLTTIGSPNFGFRSLDKDLECQLWLLTSHAELKEQLRQERDRLFEQSARVSEGTFEADERKPTLLVKVAAALSKGHL